MSPTPATEQQRPRRTPTRWRWATILLVVVAGCAIWGALPANSPIKGTIIQDNSEPLTGEERTTMKLDKDPDRDCPFRNSSLYRSIFVYPNPHDEPDLFHRYRATKQNNNTTSTTTNTTVIWPWILQRDTMKRQGTDLYDMDKYQVTQFSLDLVVYDIMVHPSSCLKTIHADQAQLFFVPFLPSVARHSTNLGGDSPSLHRPFEEALAHAMMGQYEGWQDVFGLTDQYWQQRQGRDHIVVMPEPLHGLYHPRGKRGFHHYIKTQKQLRAPIVVSVELSTTFVETFPRCARKNIVLPYPNIDGRWVNGRWDEQAAAALANHVKDLNSNDKRKMPVWYAAGNHGECLALRQALQMHHQCDNQHQPPADLSLSWNNKQMFAVGMRWATFCPCPGGDSPSAKRMLDAVLAGCIPVILSHDFVWPFSTELPPAQKSNGKGQQPTRLATARRLDPSTFSIRLNASDFDRVLYNTSYFDTMGQPGRCQRIHSEQLTLQEYLLLTVDSNEVARLQQGLKRAAYEYSYFQTAVDATEASSFPDNPMRAGILPQGGAVFRLLMELELRANAIHRRSNSNELDYWEQCQQEVEHYQEQSGGTSGILKKFRTNKC